MTPHSSQGKVEWMQKNPFTTKDLGLREVWQAGHASRDEDVKRLRWALETVLSVSHGYRSLVQLAHAFDPVAEMRAMAQAALKGPK